MIKPEYIFLWILFHLGAVELPSVISKGGKPQTIATTYVNKMQYAEAISVYKNIGQVKTVIELRSLSKAFSQLGFNDTAIRILQIIEQKFPDKYNNEDKMNLALLHRRAGNMVESDAIIANIKNSEYSSVALWNEFANDFLKKSNYLEQQDLNLKYYKFKKTGQTFLPVFDKLANKWYYHERPYVSSGLLNSVSFADNTPYSKIYESISGMDTLGIQGKILPNQYLNRYFELSYIDSNGTFYVTTNHGLVSDDNRYLLDIFQFKYDQKLDDYKLTPLSPDKWLYNYSSFVMNDAQNKALFCSDMAGGLGSADVYLADITWDSKGEPEIVNPLNLGDAVNTILPENDPFFITDDLIVFASEGHIGIGGQDIFIYQISTNTLLNAGRFVNTQFDEFAPRYYNGKLYFSSNRSMNQSRIFSVELTIEKIISAFNSTKDSNISELYASNNSNSEFANSANQLTEKSIENYLKYFSTVNPERWNYLKGLEFLMLSDSMRFVKIEEINDSSDYRDFAFLTLRHPSGDIVLFAEYEKELMYLSEVLHKRNDWMVEIRSHTDSRGSEKHNRKLSSKRADFIANYLKILGVRSEQINAVGFGESLLSNHCIDGAPCSDEEHAVNRRTELILKKRNIISN